MTDPNIGRELSRRYLLMSLLGQGAMGRVYEAKDTLLGGVPVAVKFLAQTLMNDRMRDRFEREATTCAVLGQRSIHIVSVRDYGVDERDGVPFYVMEYLRGENLSSLISQKPIALPRFLHLVRQVCLGLKCAHEGIEIDGVLCPIVHRDIKPSNILVTKDSSLGELAKILDFGIAKMLQADSDQTNCFMGTLAYSSPEQMEGKELDARSDIYSLGVMMFQMLTGKMPIQADTHTFGGWYKAHHYHPPRTFDDINPYVKIPKVLESIVMGCLSKAPGDRPQSMTEVIKALDPLERRYVPGWEKAQELETILERTPVREKPDRLPFIRVDDIFKFASWPVTRPIAEIVFPNAFRTSKGPLATLWVMLGREDIERRRTCTRYNQFLFYPPALLWLTVLYSHQHGPRWLPCYLDLKSTDGQQMARLLAQSGEYRVIFFAKEEPQRCADVQLIKIAPEQARLLQDWITTTQTAPVVPAFGTSKNQLKSELQKLKPRIEMNLEAIYSNPNLVS